MKLSEFLLKKTQALELCVIRDSGWIVATFFIDYEDLFSRYLDNRLGNAEVKSDEWDYLPIVNENGAKIQIWCHFIDV